jgi:DNA-3-methyladenine glycosylase I
MRKHCQWVENARPEMIAYHDEEWGVPVRDDRKLFEMLTLGGAQAGLSWDTVLRKRAGYQELFHGFDIEKCARMTDAYIEKILQDPSIIRNRLKVHSVRKNARAILDSMEEYGTFSKLLWSFVGDQSVVNRIKKMSDIPVTSPKSDAMSKSLKKLGFSFVGSTICYAFMQCVGMVNDHEVSCFRYEQLRTKN